jgi:predicted nucleotidyltransferase
MPGCGRAPVTERASASVNPMNAVSPEKRAEIQAHLDAIEAEHGLRVLFACESGSRAWGFASPDSDHDVRFIYVRPRDWYLTIAPGRDVVEIPIDDEMDISGWDLRKALSLLRAGNATVIEWFDSPIVYREAQGFADAVRALATASYRRDRSFHHYLAQSAKAYAEALGPEDVRLKKFLYALRAALAASWSLDREGPPPMRLGDLADAQVTDGRVRHRIDELVAAKSGLIESAVYRVPTELVDYLRETHARLESAGVERVAPGPASEFDALFRAWLGEC